MTTYCGVCPVKSWRTSRAGVAWAQVSRRSDTGPVPGGVVMNDQMSREPKGAGIRLSGMTGFTVMWVGQVVSLVGSAMTSFAVMVWLWERTGRATPLPCMGRRRLRPRLPEPVCRSAGRQVGSQGLDGPEHYAALSTVAMLVLHRMDLLEVWHLYALAVLTGFGAFQFRPFLRSHGNASKRHYARASAMNRWRRLHRGYRSSTRCSAAEIHRDQRSVCGGHAMLRLLLPLC